MKLITCWHDGEDYDENLCIQRRRSAKIFAERGQTLPFSQCLKCEPGMEEPLKRQYANQFCQLCEKSLSLNQVKAGTKYCVDCLEEAADNDKTKIRGCLICKDPLPENSSRRRKYCEFCRVEQKSLQSGLSVKKYRTKQKKPTVKKCLVCKVALPGSVANNMKFCDACRREQILIQKRRGYLPVVLKISI